LNGRVDTPRERPQAARKLLAVSRRRLSTYLSSQCGLRALTRKLARTLLREQFQ
jgi:hypothetical protein